MEWADGPFHQEYSVKGKGSREWMIATTVLVSDWWHNWRENTHLTSASVFKTVVVMIRILLLDPLCFVVITN